MLKELLQVHEKLVSIEKKLPFDHAMTAEVNLRNDLTQDLKWKQKQVLAFIVTLIHCLSHIVCG